MILNHHQTKTRVIVQQQRTSECVTYFLKTSAILVTKCHFWFLKMIYEEQETDQSTLFIKEVATNVLYKCDYFITFMKE